MRRSLPVLALLVALVGGWAGASVHHAHHGVEWGHERAAHLASGAHDAGTDLLTPPCTDDVAHEAPCGICPTLHGTADDKRAAPGLRGNDGQVETTADVRDGRRVSASSARGPPLESA